MRLCAATGDGVPSFYVDTDGVYWMFHQAANYVTTLDPVERAWIEEHHPTVDPDRLLLGGMYR